MKASVPFHCQFKAKVTSTIFQNFVLHGRNKVTWGWANDGKMFIYGYLPFSVTGYICCCPPPPHHKGCMTFQNEASLLQGQAYSRMDITTRVTWAFTLEQFGACGQKGSILNQNRSESSQPRASRCRAPSTEDTSTHSFTHSQRTKSQSQHGDLPSSIIVAAWAIQCNKLVILLQSPFSRLLKRSYFLQTYRATWCLVKCLYFNIEKTVKTKKPWEIV